jgi:ATP synthase protein I
MAGDQNKSSEQGSTSRNLAYGIMIPTMFGACVVVGCLLGYWLDVKLGSSPWLTLLGLILGLAAGIREILRMLKRMGDK